MPFTSHRSFSSPEDSRSASRRADEPPDRERLIPFPARTPAESGARERRTRRRAEMRDLDRSAMPRRPRRRRHTTPWLQRNALSVAALSVLIALLGLGFGLVQVLNRPEPAPALLAVSTPEQAPMMVAASAGVTSLPIALPIGVTSGAREITAAAKVIEPNYTVAPGDTLGRIASNYNTTVERIQAFNTIPDARALRIGARLVIPPPL